MCDTVITQSLSNPSTEKATKLVYVKDNFASYKEASVLVHTYYYPSVYVTTGIDDITFMVNFLDGKAEIIAYRGKEQVARHSTPIDATCKLYREPDKQVGGICAEGKGVKGCDCANFDGWCKNLVDNQCTLSVWDSLNWDLPEDNDNDS